MKHWLFVKWLDSPSHTWPERVWWVLFKMCPRPTKVRSADRDHTPIIDLNPRGRRG